MSSSPATPQCSRSVSGILWRGVRSMRGWIRNGLAWRFSLRRLILAVLFLAVFVGLNIHGPQYSGRCYQGWPLPIAVQVRRQNTTLVVHDDYLPWTHATYGLTSLDLVEWLSVATKVKWKEQTRTCYLTISGAIIDILFRLTVLAYILFRHPRRKPPEPEGTK